MANENRYYKTPFAESGNKTEVPDISTGGAVGYDTGFGPDYELPQGTPSRKRIKRDMFNGLNNSITKNLKQWQEGLYPTWIEDDGTGSAFSYSEDMIVAHAGQDWVSLEGANQEEPGVGTKWLEYLPVTSESFDSLTSAVAFVAANPSAIERLSTASKLSESECVIKNIDYPDGNGANYVVKVGGVLERVNYSRHKWEGMLDLVKYKMYTRQPVNLGFYGDSIVAGLGTPNYPGSNSTGTNYINPEAFCVRMAEALENIYETTITTWNAGYSGEGIITDTNLITPDVRGFAYANIDAAMFDNSFYGDPDLLFLHFGLNDISASMDDMDDVINRWVIEYELLINDKLLNRSALPVLLTTSVISQSFNRDTATRDNEKAQGAINNAIYSLGSRYGIPVIDLNSIMKDWFNKNIDGIQQNIIIFDYVHPTEQGHKFIGTALASEFIRDLVNLKEGEVDRIDFQDSRYHYNHNSTSSVIVDANQSRYGIHPNISAGSYVAAEVLSFVDVWCADPSTTLVLRNFANYGQSISVDQTDLARVKVYSYDDINTPYYNETLAGATGFLPLLNTDVDRPYRLCNLKYGYNRIELIAPLVTTTNVQMGYFEFNSKFANQIQGSYLTGGTVYTDYWQTNALQETGPCYFSVAGATDTQTMIVPNEAKSGANIVDFGAHGEVVDLLVEVKLDINTGIIFCGGKSYTDTDGVVDNAILLYRSGVSNLRLALYRKSGILNLNGANSSTITLTDEVKLLIRCTKHISTGAQNIKVFDSWAATTEIINWDSDVDQGDRTVPYSGVAVGAWLSDAISGGVKEVHINSAMIRNHT